MTRLLSLQDGDEEEDHEADEEEVSDEEDLGDALLDRTKSAFDGIFNGKVGVSQRLAGELIVYAGIQCPSVAVVNIFKRLL